MTGSLGLTDLDDPEAYLSVGRYGSLSRHKKLVMKLDMGDSFGILGTRTDDSVIR